jgi:hypothetical protein
MGINVVTSRAAFKKIYRQNTRADTPTEVCERKILIPSNLPELHYNGHLLILSEHYCQSYKTTACRVGKISQASGCDIIKSLKGVIKI